MLFEQIKGLLNEDMTGKVGSVYKFELKGSEPGIWLVDIKNGAGINFVEIDIRERVYCAWSGKNTSSLHIRLTAFKTRKKFFYLKLAFEFRIQNVRQITQINEKFFLVDH